MDWEKGRKRIEENERKVARLGGVCEREPVPYRDAGVV